MGNKASGELMNDFRHERKYVIPYEAQHNIYHIISLIPAQFKEIYHERQINNIYFDTINYDSYKANLHGFGSRNKIRVRWYGDMYGQISSVLEIKIPDSLLHSASKHFEEFRIFSLYEFQS